MASRKPLVVASAQVEQVQSGDVVGARATASGSTSNPSSSSAGFVLIPEMTVTLITSGGDLRLDFDATLNIQQLADDLNYALFLDGAELAGTRRELTCGLSVTLGILTINSKAPCSVHCLVQGVAAGSHTVEARWAAVSGTARANGTQRKITAIEVF